MRPETFLSHSGLCTSALTIGSEELARLEALSRSRTEPASRVERARILLA
jgi:hypothetical protein